MATQPADRPVERADARHEADRPADHGYDRDLVGAEVVLLQEVARDGPPRQGEPQTSSHGGDDVQPSHEAASRGRRPYHALGMQGAHSASLRRPVVLTTPDFPGQ